MKEGTIIVEYCKSEDMIADMLTKGLFGEKLTRPRSMTGLQVLK